MSFLPTGSKGNRETIQTLNTRVDEPAQNVIDTLVEAGFLDNNTFNSTDVQSALVRMEESGQVTQSNNVQLARMPDAQAQSTVIVNGVSRTSGDAVGFGTFIGTFSGSLDVFCTGSGASANVGHFTAFSGAMSASSLDFEIGSGTPNYGRIFIGAPDDLLASATNPNPTHTTASLGETPGGQGLLPVPFTGSFIAANVGGAALRGFKTAESGSASSSRIFGATTSSNTRIPGGTYNAKWISGSFPNGLYYTSSTVTVQDINNISQSKFEGSICVASGGLLGNFETTDNRLNPPNNGLSIFKGGKQLNATIETVFSWDGLYGGQWRNSGSFTDNPNAGALVTGLVNKVLFAVASSGSEGTPSHLLISGSLESLAPRAGESERYSSRAPKDAFKSDGTANKSYFTFKRVVSITGEIDEFQKAKAIKEKTSRFSPR